MLFTRCLTALAILTLSFAACGGTTIVGPGERCQSSWTEDRDCVPGYECDDRSWTCQPASPRPWPSSTAPSDAGVPPGDASADTDAAAGDAAVDAKTDAEDAAAD